MRFQIIMDGSWPLISGAQVDVVIDPEAADNPALEMHASSKTGNTNDVVKSLVTLSIYSLVLAAVKGIKLLDRNLVVMSDSLDDVDAPVEVSDAPPPPGTTQIFVKTLRGVSKGLNVDLESTTVEKAKGMLEESEGIPPDMQILLYNGKQMKNEQILSRAGVTKGTTLRMAARLLGSGKRAFLATVGTVDDKEGRIKDLKEAIGAAAIRVNAMPRFCLIVDNLVADLARINHRLVVLREAHILSTALGNEDDDDLSNLLDTIGSSNNLKVRLDKIKALVFKEKLEQLDEVAIQVAKAREMIALYTELLLAHEFANLMGAVQWGDFIKKVLGIITNRAIRNAVNNGAAIGR